MPVLISSEYYAMTMMHFLLGWIILPRLLVEGFAPTQQQQQQQQQTSSLLIRRVTSLDAQEENLLDLAKKLKLEVFDLDDGVYGLDVQDHDYGLKVVQATLPINHDGSLGIFLTQVAGNNDGRGLVMISDTTNPIFQIGDVITGVMTLDKKSYKENTAGMNYDRLVEIINEAKEAASKKDNTLLLEVNRLVKRAKVEVEIELGNGETKTIHALAGENLRRMVIRKNVKLYDPKTKRLDQPFNTGDCAGEGICGTCLVAVKEGAENLNPKSEMEKYITRGRPEGWRAACQVFVAPDNKEGKVRVQLHPQSGFQDELDPGVRNVHP